MKKIFLVLIYFSELIWVAGVSMKSQEKGNTDLMRLKSMNQCDECLTVLDVTREIKTEVTAWEAKCIDFLRIFEHHFLFAPRYRLSISNCYAISR